MSGLTGVIDRLKLKSGKLSHPIGTLSGGNQQKAVLGRALAASPGWSMWWSWSW